jgi:hypothetical protein
LALGTATRHGAGNAGRRGHQRRYVDHDAAAPEDPALINEINEAFVKHVCTVRTFDDLLAVSGTAARAYLERGRNVRAYVEARLAALVDVHAALAAERLDDLSVYVGVLWPEEVQAAAALIAATCPTAATSLAWVGAHVLPLADQPGLPRFALLDARFLA